MTCKNKLNIATIVAIGILFSFSIGTTNIYAEENNSDYKMAGDVTPVLTFIFRDGVETHEFPVFKMGENLVSNSGATFSVEGTVTSSPLLHKAMDDAYKYRLVSSNGYEYQSKYFDVDVNFVANDESVMMLDYNNCRIDNYEIETLDSNDYESYFKEVGFAIVDKIDFECSGVNFENEVVPKSTSTLFTDYGPSGFNFANDMRTSATFSFEGGVEKIEFPVFELISGYEESSSSVITAEFYLEGILNDYPLLYDAIDNSRQVSGIGSSFNTDFDTVVEFTNGESVLRGFDFRDCRVKDAQITTQFDKEEGFTGKSGFAVVHQLKFACSGFDPINMYYDGLRANVPVWKATHVENSYEEPIQNFDKGVKTVSTFTYADGSETIEFTMFGQNDVLIATENVFIDDKATTENEEFTKKSKYPSFELRGVVGDYPMLYKITDDNRSILGVSGTQLRTLFDVDVNIVKDDEIIRSFTYSNCRVIDYEIHTDNDKEESYIKDKFALINIFDFECQGYHPGNPVYDAMFNSYEKAETQSSNDLRNTDQWPPGFSME